MGLWMKVLKGDDEGDEFFGFNDEFMSLMMNFNVFFDKS